MLLEGHIEGYGRNREINRGALLDIIHVRVGRMRHKVIADAEQACEKAAFPGQEQSYAVTGPDASGDQIVGDDIRLFIQFAVSQCRIPGNQRDLIRVFRGTALKQLMQQDFRDLGSRQSKEYYRSKTVANNLFIHLFVGCGYPVWLLKDAEP